MEWWIWNGRLEVLFQEIDLGKKKRTSGDRGRLSFVLLYFPSRREENGLGMIIQGRDDRYRELPS